jgi:hypothetical protein
MSEISGAFARGEAREGDADGGEQATEGRTFVAPDTKTCCRNGCHPLPFGVSTSPLRRDAAN